MIPTWCQAAAGMSQRGCLLPQQSHNFCLIICSSLLTTVQFMHSCLTCPELLREEDGCEDRCTSSISWRERGGGEREREEQRGCVRMSERSLLAVGVYFCMCVCFLLCVLHNGDILQVNKWLRRRKSVTMTDEEATQGLIFPLPYLALNLELSWSVLICECNMLLLFLGFLWKSKSSHLEEMVFLSFCGTLSCIVYCQSAVLVLLITIHEGAAAAVERR